MLTCPRFHTELRGLGPGRRVEPGLYQVCDLGKVTFWPWASVSPPGKGQEEPEMVVERWLSEPVLPGDLGRVALALPSPFVK